MPTTRTVGDLGAAVRAARKARGWTQTDLAHRAGVSRDWVVRFEKGSPRLEAQAVLDAVAAVGLSLTVATPPTSTQTGAAKQPHNSPAKAPRRHSAKPANLRKPLTDSATSSDPFADVFSALNTKSRQGR